MAGGGISIHFVDRFRVAIYWWDVVDFGMDLPLKSVFSELFKSRWGVGLCERDDCGPVILVGVGHVYIDELRPLDERTGRIIQ